MNLGMVCWEREFLNLKDNLSEAMCGSLEVKQCQVRIINDLFFKRNIVETRPGVQQCQAQGKVFCL